MHVGMQESRHVPQWADMSRQGGTAQSHNEVAGVVCCGAHVVEAQTLVVARPGVQVAVGACASDPWGSRSAS